MATKIQLRGDTLQNLLIVDPVLLLREVVLYGNVINEYTDYKIGDGIRKFSELPAYGLASNNIFAVGVLSVVVDKNGGKSQVSVISIVNGSLEGFTVVSSPDWVSRFDQNGSIFSFLVSTNFSTESRNGEIRLKQLKTNKEVAFSITQLSEADSEYVFEIPDNTVGDVPALGSALSVPVISTVGAIQEPFDILASPDWITASTSTAYLNLIVKLSDLDSAREGIVYLIQKASGKTATVYVTQNGAEFLFKIVPDSITISGDSMEREYEVYSARNGVFIPYAVVYEETWIETVANGSILTADYQQNGDGVTRYGKITLQQNMSGFFAEIMTTQLSGGVSEIPAYSGVTITDAPNALEIEALPKVGYMGGDYSETYTTQQEYINFWYPEAYPAFEKVTDSAGIDIADEFEIQLKTIGTIQYRGYVAKGWTTEEKTVKFIA